MLASPIHLGSRIVQSGPQYLQRRLQPCTSAAMQASHLALAVRQGAAHREAVAQITHTRYDDQVECIARLLITEHGVG